MKPINLKDYLQHHHYSYTLPRQQIFDLIIKQENIDRPTIIKYFAKKIDMVTIYRTLDLFVKLGLVSFVNTGKNGSYEINNSTFHHHHIFCHKCQRLVDIDNPILEDLIKDILESNDFSYSTHTLEISSICKTCL